MFYQKGFADTDGRLWMYDRRLKRFTKPHPKVICCENDLYTIAPDSGANRVVESRYLRVIDSAGARAIRQIEHGRPGHDAITALAAFAAHQITRTPFARDTISGIVERIGEDFARMSFATPERAKENIKLHRERTGEMVDVTPESMVEFVHGEHMKVTVSETPFLTNMIKQATTLTSCIAMLDWQVLMAPPTGGFIICDYPFVLVPPPGHNTARFGIGLGILGSVKYFPLTRSLCLCMGDPGENIRYRTVGADVAAAINHNIAVNSERFIMGPSQAQLEGVIARSETVNSDPIPRSTFEVVREGPDSALHKFTVWPERRYIYPQI